MSVEAKHSYGRAIAFTWRPIVDNQEVTAAELVSARLYGPTTEPTTAQKQNTETGHVDEQTTWVSTDEGQYLITFDAQVDADPTSANRYDVFFAVVNFKYTSGGATVFDDEVLYLYRPDSLTSAISVSVEDIHALEPRVAYVAESAEWVEQQIELAKEDIYSRLVGEGYTKHRLFNLQEFDPCAKRWATSYVCYALEGEGNPHWATKGKRWEERAEQLYKSTVVGYDISGTDKPAPDQVKFTGAVAILR